MEKLENKSSNPNFNELEKEILKFWEENKIFEKSLEQTKDGEPFIFYDGPPFATGLPHYGSILPSVIKDAIPRYQTMKGRYVRRRWGWDCHGLPIENIVEQKLKISGKKQIEEIGVEKFNQECRANVLKYVEEWGKTIKRIARWVDFGPPSLWSPGVSKVIGGPSAEALAKADEGATADVAQLENNKLELRNSYKTMDTSYMESVWWGIKQIWEKGLIYEDRKVLLYCSRCETPISNFEVAMDNSYREVAEESVYAKFKLPKGQRIVNDLTNDRTYALAWTTTPWTLPGNTSLNIGPDIVYVIIEQDKERYILSKDRLSIIEGEYEIIAEFPARALEGLRYEPLYPTVVVYPNDRAHKIYIADFVTTTDGTGIVHNAALYGEEDYQLAKEKNLPREDMLDHQGKYINQPNIPEHLRTVFFKDADNIILKELKEQGKVYKTENYLHSYPHCYRCGTPLFYNALPAWFIDIQKIRQDLLQNNETVNWYPEHLKHGRFMQGIENAPDWNISRNRYWATALPFWKCGNEGCRNFSCIGSIQELRDKSINFEEVYPNEGKGDRVQGIDDSTLNPKPSTLDLHRPYIDQIKLKCDKCGGVMNRIPEVVDCWVESGSMPFAELHFPFERNAESRGNQMQSRNHAEELPPSPSFEKRGSDSVENFQSRFPADFVVEYIPQTRAWFYVMHVICTILFGKAPFKNVVTTGTILAEDGSKMSKSKNNYPDPHLVIEKYGADALRFYLLTSTVVLGEDLNFSEKGVAEINKKVGLILYNVWSFLKLYTKEKFTGGFPTSKNVLDKWVLAKLLKAHKVVTENLDDYNTVKAGKELVEFINDLSTWYVRRSRERIKAGGEDGKCASETLAYVLVELSKLLAPFMPFLAEFIFQDITGKESVHLEEWSIMDKPDEEVIDKMEIVRELVSVGLAVRKQKNLAVRQPLAALAFELHDEKINLGDEYFGLILDELNVKKIQANLVDKDSRPEGVVALQGAKFIKNFYLDLNLTPELKKEGLARELERQVQDLRKKSGLKVGELVDLYYNTQDENVEQVLLSLLDRKKTFVSQINKSLEVEVDFETQSQVDGKPIWLGLIKV